MKKFFFSNSITTNLIIPRVDEKTNLCQPFTGVHNRLGGCSLGLCTYLLTLGMRLTPAASCDQVTDTVDQQNRRARASLPLLYDYNDYKFKQYAGYAHSNEAGCTGYLPTDKKPRSLFVIKFLYGFTPA